MQIQKNKQPDNLLQEFENEFERLITNIQNERNKTRTQNQ